MADKPGIHPVKPATQPAPVSDTPAEIITSLEQRVAKLKRASQAQAFEIKDLYKQLAALEADAVKPEGFRAVRVSDNNTLFAFGEGADADQDQFADLEEALAHARSLGARLGNEVIAVLPIWKHKT